MLGDVLLHLPKMGVENAKNYAESGPFISLKKKFNVEIGVRDLKLVYWSGIK